MIDFVKLSKYMSMLLRHRPEVAGLSILLESRQCAAKITSINALLAKARSLMSQDSKVADFLKDLE
jgi:RNA:NAD 2'-phosphotransferase (TPT1/KptA family)